MTRGGKGEGKNQAAGAFFPCKFKVGKRIPLYGEKVEREKIKLLELL